MSSETTTAALELPAGEFGTRVHPAHLLGMVGRKDKVNPLDINRVVALDTLQKLGAGAGAAKSHPNTKSHHHPIVRPAPGVAGLCASAQGYCIE